MRTPEQVEEIVAEAAQANAVIFYTLVGAETRRTMRRASGRELVPTVDVLGPAFSALHDAFESRPGFLVTGNLYLPRAVEKGGRHPAVLGLCGHADAGKFFGEGLAFS